MDIEQLELQIENNWHVKSIFTILDKKCGEIFVETNERFYIVCTFCIIRFTEFEEFITHYSHNHGNESASYTSDPLDTLKTELRNNDVETHYYNENIEDVESDDLNESVDELTTSNKEEIIPCINEENKVSTTKIITDSESILHQESKTSKKIRKNKISYACDSCERTFKNKKRLEDHKRYDHLPIDDPFINNISQQYQTSDDSGSDEKTKKETERMQQIKIDPTRCRYCDRVFESRLKRMEHERVYHTNEKPFQCIQCGKCFATDSNLIHHRKSQHLIDKKPHECEICRKNFKTKKMLREHYASHSDVRRFTCKICNKGFKYKKGLQSHENIHSESIKYSCNICGEGFKQYSRLYHHIKVHKRVEKLQ